MTTALNIYAQKKIVGNPDYPVRDANAIDINQVAVSRPPVPFGYKPATTAGLTLGYYGGEMWVDGALTNIADGTLALTASATNYVEADRAGAISKNTTSFTAGRTPLYEITTDGGSITAINDRRIGNAPLTGRLSKSVAGGAGDTTLTAAEARNNILEFTGALTGARNIIVPSVASVLAIYNNTSGAYALTVKTAAGSGVAVTQGKRALLYCDGTNVVGADNDMSKVGANIASAATINLSTATGNLVHITGTTATSAVTMIAGQWMRCIADGAWPLTYHATNNRISGGVNYTCAAGDTIDYFYDGTTVIGNITKKDGTPVVAASAATETAAGIVELATTAEATAGTDTSRAVTAAGVEAHMNGNALGWNQTWQNVTGSRALGTTYTNTTSHPIDVLVCAVVTNGGNLSLNLNGGGNIQVIGGGAANGVHNTFGFTVPAGQTYALNAISGTPALISWQELR